VLHDTDHLGDLETAAARGDEDAEILGTHNVEDLVELLQQPPQLRRVIERLIYFVPAVEPVKV
jgi:hypothetical protein